MTAVEIAMAHPSDLDGINRIRRQIRTPDLYDGLIEKNEKQVTFVAKNDAQTLGYLSLHSRASLQDPGDAEFEVFVLPGAQGNGIGTSLMTAAEEFVLAKTRICRLTLHVMKTNPRARQLYERIGFHTLSQEPPLGEIMGKDVKR